LRLAEFERRLALESGRVAEAVKGRLLAAGSRVESLSAQLAHLSPLAVLERGYAIVQREDGAVVKAAEEAPAGAALKVRLARGRLRVSVTESIPGGSSGLPS
jgi:exodeoxyribonuclease VII large subunit